MKKIFLLGTLFCMALCAGAYQTGPANRANFGAAQQSAQSAQQNGYRSFSNYNNRTWGQGVQTQTVQTSVAGSTVKEFEAPTKSAPVGKQSAQPAQAAKPTAKPAAAQSAASTTTATATAPASDPAAMLQQVQGMMQNMQSLTGGTSQGAQQPSATGQMGTPSTGMPAGMPDISALMGGMMPAAPSAAPATSPKK